MIRDGITDYEGSVCMCNLQMASSGIPGVTWEAVTYVERSLLQDNTNAEAGAMFSRMIQDSLKSWFTQVGCTGLWIGGKLMQFVKVAC